MISRAERVNVTGIFVVREDKEMYRETAELIARKIRDL